MAIAVIRGGFGTAAGFAGGFFGSAAAGGGYSGAFAGGLAGGYGAMGTGMVLQQLPSRQEVNYRGKAFSE